MIKISSIIENGIKNVIEARNFNNISDIDDLYEKPILTKRVRPLQASYSIGSVKANHTGTLGCIVFDNNTNSPHILSNNHILANFNKLLTKSIIVQSSVKDSILTLLMLLLN